MVSLALSWFARHGLCVLLLLFRGEGVGRLDWIVSGGGAEHLTSLFNSHIFDFHEGWMYVLGVSLAGGVVLNDISRRGRGTYWKRPVMISGMYAGDKISADEGCPAHSQFVRIWSIQ
jgi:hypothetical protein